MALRSCSALLALLAFCIEPCVAGRFILPRALPERLVGEKASRAYNFFGNRPRIEGRMMRRLGLDRAQLDTFLQKQISFHEAADALGISVRERVASRFSMRPPSVLEEVGNKFLPQGEGALTLNNLLEYVTHQHGASAMSGLVATSEWRDNFRMLSALGAQNEMYEYRVVGEAIRNPARRGYEGELLAQEWNIIAHRKIVRRGDLNRAGWLTKFRERNYSVGWIFSQGDQRHGLVVKYPWEYLQDPSGYGLVREP